MSLCRLGFSKVRIRYNFTLEMFCKGTELSQRVFIEKKILNISNRKLKVESSFVNRVIFETLTMI